MTAVTPHPLVGGRYEVLRRLGEPSGQGDVYAALDTHEGDVVALKLMKSSPPGGVWMEARILRTLADKHILPIRNADVDAGRPYLVTELATHGSLDNMLAASGQRGLDIPFVVRSIRRACFGLERAHDLKLLHNDMKPANLFLDAKGECLVGDFGLATAIPAGSNSTRIHGCTAETAAPEIAADPVGPNASIQSDVYSLGATAYWMLSGKPPIDLTAAPDFMAKLALAATLQPGSLRDVAPHVPLPLQRVINAAMDPDRSKRFARAVDLATALGSLPRPSRLWSRTDEHADHVGCWRGTPVGSGSIVILCACPAHKPSQVDVTAAHASSGRAIRGARRTGPLRNLASMVRSAMTSLP